MVRERDQELPKIRKDATAYHSCLLGAHEELWDDFCGDDAMFLHCL